MSWVQSKIAGKTGGDRKAVTGNFGLNPTFLALDGRDQTKNIAGIFTPAPMVTIFLLRSP